MEGQCRNTLGDVLSCRVATHFSSFRAKTFLYDAPALEALERALLVEMRELAKRFLQLQTSVEGLTGDKAKLQQQVQTMSMEKDDRERQWQSHVADTQRQLHQSQVRMQMQVQLWEREKGMLKSQWEIDVAEQRQAALDRILHDAAMREERHVRRLEEDKNIEIEYMRRHLAFEKDTELSMLANQLSRRAHQDMEVKVAAILAEVQEDQRRNQARIQHLENQLREHGAVHNAPPHCRHHLPTRSSSTLA
ncbi:hypothetical protein DYB34_000680 [Aphanomyces astaci]|uniref:Uncharacterized protein n=2 Tax=Aphanomyces astaci TaxID=112090 RepID=A0A418C7T1_APHAT|nr:hypothetical protein DYB34_000680 [Aphanomyces astaci]